MRLLYVVLVLIYRIFPSPIFRAIHEHRIEDIRSLMALPHHLRSRDRWGNLPIMSAIREGQTEIALGMLDLGSPAAYQSKHGASPLSIAAMIGDSLIGAALIDRGADVNEQLTDPDGAFEKMTPLMWAVNRRQLAFAKLLLDRGADVSIVNGQKQTALMFADDGTPECHELLVMLLEKATDPQVLLIKDWRGRTLIDEARDRSQSSGKTEMSELITARFPSSYPRP